MAARALLAAASAPARPGLPRVRAAFASARRMVSTEPGPAGANPTSLRRTGVLLVNTGTPDSVAVRDVRKYLRQFLMDPRVVDLPFPIRWILVNLIIAPFRSFSSAKLYTHIFTDRGSPLKAHGLDVAALLQRELGNRFTVRLAMRYQSPSMEGALAELHESGLDHVVLVPLFPQYASASSGSVMEHFMRIASRWSRLPHLSIVSNYWAEDSFLQAWEDLGRPFLMLHDYDLVVFSYHGVPERHIAKGSCGAHCRMTDECCGVPGAATAFCYRAQCVQTSRALAARLGLQSEQYETVFQSRLGRAAWLRPYLSDKIGEFVERGKKKVLVLCPSFVADCLETISEIGIESREEFLAKGGERWDVVPCPNLHPAWIRCLRDLVLRLDAARHPHDPTGA